MSGSVGTSGVIFVRFLCWCFQCFAWLTDCVCVCVSSSAVSIEAVCADDLLSVTLYLLVKTEIPNWWAGRGIRCGPLTLWFVWKKPRRWSVISGVIFISHLEGKWKWTLRLCNVLHTAYYTGYYAETNTMELHWSSDTKEIQCVLGRWACPISSWRILRNSFIVYTSGHSPLTQYCHTMQLERTTNSALPWESPQTGWEPCEDELNANAS